jgi:predicted nucleotidyltransferase/plasmid maintenance system antidote protein VapI
MKLVTPNSFGVAIRKLRTEKELTLRIVAEFLDIDQAILSKVERGQRKASREMAVKLAAYFKVKKEELVAACLADKIIYEMQNEDMASKALQLAEEQIAYAVRHSPSTEKKAGRKKLMKAIQLYFQSQNKVSKAWVFGSFARKEEGKFNDIDIMIRVKPDIKFSLFDLVEIQFQLEKITGKKIDLMEEGQLLPFAQKTAQKDLIPVFEQTNT